MDKKLVKAINDQITKELFSGYLYLSMAAYFEDRNLSGCSHWMKFQAKEELEHAMKFFGFLCDRGEKVELGAIDKPASTFKSIKDVFEQTLEHEKTVTASINNLYSMATKLEDNPSVVLLQWYINEQVEEEKNPTEILAKMQYIKEDSSAVILLDKELAKRA
ncbi:MAG: ferritin [Candidatus Omnitrophica bacterium]|nr:ferritin [Candidatus Omnitrophota bacterium]